MNKDNEQEFYKHLIDEIIKTNPTAKQLNLLKIRFSKEFKFDGIVKNSQIIANASSSKRADVIKILNVKPVRELSGVSVVALFAKPHNCPHGRCIYCPGGIGSEFGDTPQSYTGSEPAALRAIRNDYDAYFQVFNRLEHYVINGHFPDKIELIFMGGTFPSMDKNYRDWFVNFVYKAINDFGDEFVIVNSKGKKQINYEKFNEFFIVKEDLNSKRREVEIYRKVDLLKNENVKDYKYEISRNETGVLRSIGLTVETKPDWAMEEHLNEVLKYGCTRLEIGVQTLRDDILKKVNRGHGIAETIKCFQVAKDMCFKINAHMMVGLPGSDLKSDEKDLKDLFSDSRFRPDMLKIYPCLVVKGTPLFRLFEKGEFTPIETKAAAKVIAKGFESFPRYVRVMRVQRDIPTQNISGGVVNSNLRQYVEKEMTENGIVSSDIREREIGLKSLNIYGKAKEKIDTNFEIKVEEYESSGGRDFFIDVVNANDVLIGFIRLRFISKDGFRDEINEKTALIRELHIYGVQTPVGQKGKSLQHKGWGKKLLDKAEEIAKKNGFEKMAIISGVGVREYYRKYGYELEGAYMTKFL